MIHSNSHILRLVLLILSPSVNAGYDRGLGLEDESAGEAICEKQLHFTWKNREARKKSAAIVYIAEQASVKALLSVRPILLS
jgi:hypothetical protein